MISNKPYVNQNFVGLSSHLIRELRSDHAGETGAVYIYKGITTIAKLYRDHELIEFARCHGVTESEHLRLIESWLEPKAQSYLLGLWRIAGWFTGAIPTIFGRQSIYATVAAVETFVDFHYQQQIEHLQHLKEPRELLTLLLHCQGEERHHRDEATEKILTKLPLSLRIWCALVSSGSKFAVLVARRI